MAKQNGVCGHFNPWREMDSDSPPDLRGRRCYRCLCGVKSRTEGGWRYRVSRNENVRRVELLIYRLLTATGRDFCRPRPVEDECSRCRQDRKVNERKQEERPQNK